MAGKKPDFKITAKSKTSGESIGVFAFWKNDNGMYGGQLDKSISKIITADGKAITAENVYFNFYDNREDNEQNQTQTPTPPTSNQAYDVPAGADENDVPF